MNRQRLLLSVFLSYVRSIFLLACPILVLICHAQISSTRSTGPCTTLFAEVNIGQRAAESRSRNDRRDKRFTFVKFTYPYPEWEPNTYDKNIMQ